MYVVSLYAGAFLVLVSALWPRLLCEYASTVSVERSYILKLFLLLVKILQNTNIYIFIYELQNVSVINVMFQSKQVG